MTKSYDLLPNNKYLTDFAYDDMKIFDDDIVIYFSGQGVTAKLICSMYIGYQYIGKWDEGIVDYAIVKEHGELLDRSIAMLNKNHSEKYLKSSAPMPINKWLLLKVLLIDGTSIEVACNSVTLVYNDILSLSYIKDIGLSITWKLIELGSNKGKFRHVLNIPEMVSYAITLKDTPQWCDTIGKIVFSDIHDIRNIKENVKKLAEKENTSYEIEFRKWRVAHIHNNLNYYESNYKYGLIELSNLGKEFNLTGDMPQVSIIDYTEESYDYFYNMYLDWINKEIEYLYNK